VKKRKKPFSDYDALLAERHEYEGRSEGEFKKTMAVAIIIGALCAIGILFLVFSEGC